MIKRKLRDELGKQAKAQSRGIYDIWVAGIESSKAVFYRHISLLDKLYRFAEPTPENPHSKTFFALWMLFAMGNTPLFLVVLGVEFVTMAAILMLEELFFLALKGASLRGMRQAEASLEGTYVCLDVSDSVGEEAVCFGKIHSWLDHKEVIIEKMLTVSERCNYYHSCSDRKKVRVNDLYLPGPDHMVHLMSADSWHNN